MSLPHSKLLRFLIGLFIALILVEVVGVLICASRLQTEKRSLKSQYRRLEQLQHREPYPSGASVEMVRKNLDELEYRVVEFRAEMRRDPFLQDNIDAAEFSARAQGVIERFRQRTSSAGIVLPVSFEAGFSEYASGGAVPDVRNVPRLLRQLYAMERVANVLVQSGVASIDQLSRDRFEHEAESPANRRRPRRTSADEKQPDNLELVASEVDPEGLYSIERIGISFSGNESAVWQVMELIASAPHFMVVSSFSHTTQTRIMSYDPEVAKKGGEEEAQRFLEDGVLTGKRALSRPERIISGNDMVKVNLVVDVYTFIPESEVQ